MQPNQKKLLIFGGAAALGAVVLFLTMKPQAPEPAPNAVYYTGAMVNKSRTMLVDEKGNIIKRLDPNRPNKDGTMVEPGRNPPADANQPAGVETPPAGDAKTTN